MFQSLLDKRHDNMRRLKEQGRRVIGYFCSYCPEEIIYAAGLVPVRLWGGEGPYPLATPHLPGYYCAYSRGCLNEGLKGSYDYLDGVVLAYTCEHTRGAYDSWRANLSTGYLRFIDLPSQVNRPEALKSLIQELGDFKDSLERAFSVTITEQSLAQAIAVYNQSRARLRQIYAYKKTPDSPLSGTEAFAAILSSMVYPKDQHNRLLAQFLSQVEARGKGSLRRPRLMLIGSELHDPGVLQAIEAAGAQVAADELCTGTRYIWQDVALDGGHLEALARRYLLGINCPTKHPSELRLGHIERLVTEYEVEAALLLHPVSCDPLGWDEPFIKKILGEKNIPTASVELGEGLTPEATSRISNAVRELRGGLGAEGRARC